MSQNQIKKVVPSQGGIFYNLALQIKLVLRLLADRRVNLLLKILPLGSLLYWLLPDFFPILIDDAVVTFVGITLFVELCPPEVVEEHLNDLREVSAKKGRDLPAEEDMLDAEFYEIGDDRLDKTKL